MAVKIPSGNDIERRLPQAHGRVFDIKPDKTGAYVAEAGRNIAAWGEKGQEREDRLDIARAKSFYLTEQIKAEQELENDPNYEKWGDMHSSRMAETKKQARGLIRSARQQEAFDIEISSHEARSVAGVLDKQKTRFNDHKIAEVVKMGETNLEAIDFGRINEATTFALLSNFGDAVDSLVASGAMRAQDGEKAKIAHGQRFATNKLSWMVANNPRGVLALFGGTAGGAGAPGAPGGGDAALINRESGGDPKIVNQFGFVGQHQFGAPRLQALGVYKPGAEEGMTGWEKSPQNAPGKWSGAFNIPGHADVKTMEQFRNSAEAQKTVAGLHYAKMDEEIKRGGFDAYIGKTVQGVEITQQSLYNMLHLGGAGSTKVALEGRGNPKDANGTSVMDYARMGSSSSGSAAPLEDRTAGIKQGGPGAAPGGKMSPLITSAPPEVQLRVFHAAQAAVDREEAAGRVEREAQEVQTLTERFVGKSRDAKGVTDEGRAIAMAEKYLTGTQRTKVVAALTATFARDRHLEKQTSEKHFDAMLAHANSLPLGVKIGAETDVFKAGDLAKLTKEQRDSLDKVFQAKIMGNAVRTDVVWYNNFLTWSPQKQINTTLAEIASKVDYNKFIEIRDARQKLIEGGEPQGLQRKMGAELFKALTDNLGLDTKNAKTDDKILALHTQFEKQLRDYREVNGTEMPFEAFKPGETNQRDILNRLFLDTVKYNIWKPPPTSTLGAVGNAILSPVTASSRANKLAEYFFPNPNDRSQPPEKQIEFSKDSNIPIREVEPVIRFMMNNGMDVTPENGMRVYHDFQKMRPGSGPVGAPASVGKPYPGLGY